jgi:hypothetical protein
MIKRSDSFQLNISGRGPNPAGVHPEHADLPGHSEGRQAGGDQQFAWPGGDDEKEYQQWAQLLRQQDKQGTFL